MANFQTDALLYPLTKGDKPGHTFHGNQYEQVASDGEIPTTRPPVGKFQFNEAECEHIADFYNDIRTREGQETSQRNWTENSQNALAVELSKMMGMDKPATVVSEIANPDFCRGSSVTGAEALAKPLVAYGGGGGMTYGPGVYAVPADEVGKEVADNYAYIAQQHGYASTVVSIKLDPDTQILDFRKPENQKVSFPTPDGMDNWSEKAQEGWKSLSYASPAVKALAQGYQGIITHEPYVVLLDRSAMTIATKPWNG